MPEMQIEFDVPAQMRDGTVLRADVYRPGGTGPWPVLLMRLPYGKQTPLLAAAFDPLAAGGGRRPGAASWWSSRTPVAGSPPKGSGSR
ncbi:hypothetical protein OG250_39480 [Streptomyces sp. NBC_00487]|uniref:CocE/NonD family hydrolase n=1 Tax=unclassified Streptomyces TaxID=2593676 RepID=UPI002E19EABE|nr:MULTISPECIES: CocE/NonD family hydrolase [unclassified Streptomyces]